MTTDITKLLKSVNKNVFYTIVPLSVNIFIAILFIAFVVFPLSQKLRDLKGQIDDKSSILTYFDLSGSDLTKLNSEIKELESKVIEYEKKLPKSEQAIVLIDVLKDITARSDLRFSSIEPQIQEEFKIGDEAMVYLELPIRVKLKCGYFDLINFLEKLETADRLMKISDFNIRGVPDNLWQHDVTLLITTFAKGSEQNQK